MGFLRATTPTPNIRMAYVINKKATGVVLRPDLRRNHANKARRSGADIDLDASRISRSLTHTIAKQQQHHLDSGVGRDGSREDHTREDPVSKKVPAASLPDPRRSNVAGTSSGRHLSRDLSPMDEDEVVHPSPGGKLAPRINKLKAGLEPGTSEHPKSKGKEPLLEHEYDEVFLCPKANDPSSYKELTGAARDHAILQRREGCLSPRTLVTVRPKASAASRDAPPSPYLDDSSSSRHRSSSKPREKDPAAIDITLMPSSLSGIRELLVDCTSELQSLLGTRQPTIRLLEDEDAYSDAALVSIRHDWNSVLLESQLKVKEAPLIPAVAPAPPRRSSVGVRLPPNHPLIRRDEGSVIDVDGESRTDTTTASVGSVSDDEDHPDPRQSSRPRAHGLDDTRHKKVDVDGITRRLTLLQYRQRRSGPSSSSLQVNQTSTEALTNPSATDVAHDALVPVAPISSTPRDGRETQHFGTKRFHVHVHFLN
ncbi:hypothetical protein BC829DRAFT_442869 [Chytridium lagenaria]|nr:hypothetical protein BC829DRAFT_442869 [Chytridium lagenaria]